MGTIGLKGGNVRQLRCRRCKQIFEPMNTLGGLCPACTAEDARQYYIVREFVKDNPGISVNEVSTLLNISTRKILTYLREERLEVAEGSSTKLSCQQCGASILTGMYCDSCKSKLNPTQKLLSSPNQVYSNVNSSVMYTANRKER